MLGLNRSEMILSKVRLFVSFYRFSICGEPNK